MKNMQTGFLKILFLFAFAMAISLSVNAQPNLKRLDSLFQARQYTQSFDLYKDIFQHGWISPAMLLRMAYIQEGLGHVSQSIYYLKLYHQVSNDEKAIKKIEELATKNKLEGYKATDENFIRNALGKFNLQITGALAAFILFFLALMVFQKRKQTRPIGAAFALLFLLTLLFVQTNFSGSPQQGIVLKPATYLMSGPSAGSSVVAIIGEGHQLKINGKNDVWLRVEWQEKEVYIKEDKLLMSSIL
jgi:hypothetical protein